VIVPAPATQADAHKRTNGGGAGLDVKTWYLSKKNLQASAPVSEVKPLVGSKN
jgi:peroxiredoxin 2/4